jgi:hypothetical protein
VEQVGIGAALVGVSFFVPGGFLLAGTALSTLLATAGAGMVLSGIGTLLTQKANGIATSSRNPLSPWQVVFGRTKVGATVVYQEEVASNNRLLLLVCAIAAHPCDEIEEVWFNNKKLPLQLNTEFSDTSNPSGFWQSWVPPNANWVIETISRTNDVVTVTFRQNASVYSQFNGETMHIHGTIDAAGGSTFEGYWPVVQIGPAAFTYTAGGPQGPGTPGTGQITTTWPAYPTGNVIVGYYKGDQTTASGIILGNSNGYWTPQSILSGRTYVALKLTYNAAVYSGLPEISFVMRGKNDIYDPRTKTRGYTNNAALCIADFLAHPLWGYNLPYDDQLPVVGESIATAELIAAANICDEQVDLALGGSENRYSCDGAWDVSVDRGEVLGNLLTSCGGRLVVLGGQHFIMPAAWVTPSGAIDIGGCSNAPKMMMNDTGLVAEYLNSPPGVYIPSCAGSTQSQFVYALGLLAAYQAVGNPNAKALAQLILSAVEPYLFRGLPIPTPVTANNIWSPNSCFDVKQPFLDENGATINVNQGFASDLNAGWRTLVGAEMQTSCDAYNWAIRLFSLAALVFDGQTETPDVDLGYGLSPYGASYGDPETANTTINSGWLAMLAAIKQMARIAYMVSFSELSGSTLTLINPLYQGGMIPFIVEFLGSPAPKLSTWLGPAYIGYQSPWAVNQVNPASVGNAVEFLAESQATLAVQGTTADSVVFTIEGVNPQTLTVPIAVKPDGTAVAAFQYAGGNIGIDSIVATLPSHSLSSNQARVAWSMYPAALAVFNVTVDVMSADGTGLFNALTPVLSTTPVQGLMFNSHPFGIFPGDPHQSGNQANPFVSNGVDVNGNYEGDEAIPNTSGRFNAVIKFQISVENAGIQGFTVLVNSAFVIGFDGGATLGGGTANLGALAGGTAEMHYPALAGLNNAGDFPGNNWAQVGFTINFPKPGVYNGEIDYSSGLFSERQFTMTTSTGAIIPNVGILTNGGATATGTAPSGQLQLTPFSGGYGVGQTAFFQLALSGITYTAPANGPFAPVYQYQVPDGAQTWGPVGVFGYFGPDPNYTAGYYQYRPLAELCDLIAGAVGNEVWYAQAVTVKTNFIAWLYAKWTVAANGPPNYFPQTGAVNSGGPDVHCAALILYSVLTLDLAARPMGAGGAAAMDTEGHALLNLVYALYQDTYLTSGPMAGTFCLDPSGGQDWSPTWSGEILRALSKLVTWAQLNNQPAIQAQATIWIDGLVDFGLKNVQIVNPNLGYTVDDLRGGVTWKPKLSRMDLFNGIKGTFISEANQWQQADVPSYAQDTIHGYTNGTPAHNNDANWDADGRRIWKDAQLPFTKSPSMAQRLFKIELLRIRWQGRGGLVGLMTMYKSAPLDVVYFSYPPHKWLNKVLEVANCRLVFQKASGPNGEEAMIIGTELDIAETDPSIYEFSVTEELSSEGYSYLPGLQNLSPD